MESLLQTTGKFTAIWQSRDYGRDWPVYEWQKHLFEPYISNHVFDGRHKVVMDNAILFDDWVYANDPEYYANSAAKTPSWCIRTMIFTTWESIDTCISVGFSARSGLLCSTPSMCWYFRWGISEEIPASSVPASDRRYAWSFVGEGGNSSPPDMIRAMSSIEPHICYSVTPIRGMAFFDRIPPGRKELRNRTTTKYSGNPCLLLRQWEMRTSNVGAPMTLLKLEHYQFWKGGRLWIITGVSWEITRSRLSIHGPTHASL